MLHPERLTPAVPQPGSRALVMGILNVTPDSFSDGGSYFDPETAVARGLEMLSEGADVIDVGGESTRPGAHAVPEKEELRRVLPAVEELARHGRVSIDTTKAAVAEAAVAAGATLINDVSATLFRVAAEAGPGVGWVAMHRQGTAATMQEAPAYTDVLAEVTAFLRDRAETAAAAGVSEIWIDPGIGFGKAYEHNLALLAGLGSLVGLGWPVLVGTSRKSFLGRLLAASDGALDPVATPVPTGDRLAGSLATAVWAVTQGALMLRVHDVLATAQAVRLTG